MPRDGELERLIGSLDEASARIGSVPSVGHDLTCTEYYSPNDVTHPRSAALFLVRCSCGARWVYVPGERARALSNSERVAHEQVIARRFPWIDR